MEKIEIKLEDETLVGLTGEDIGEKLYKEFMAPVMAPKINFDGENIIVFPKNIKVIGFAFIDGFIKKSC